MLLTGQNAWRYVGPPLLLHPNHDGEVAVARQSQPNPPVLQRTFHVLHVACVAWGQAVADGLISASPLNYHYFDPNHKRRYYTVCAYSAIHASFHYQQ